MIKQLLKQIWNERRSNGWLWVELLLVFVFLWYIVDMCYTTARIYYEPVGFDITDTYMVSLSTKTNKSSSFINPETREETAGSDLLEIVDRLRRLPEVEEVSISQNARPYTGSNSSFRFCTDTLTLTVLKRPVTPAFFRVFKYENAEGGTTDDLVNALKDGKVVVGENLLPESYKGDRRLMGKVLVDADDSTRTYPVSAVTHKVRYNDFWMNYSNRYVAQELTESSLAKMTGDVSWYEICLRVKPGTPAGFPEKLMGLSDSQFSIGNLFILKVESFKDIRNNFQISSYNQVKTEMWMLAFLMVNMFLGIVGTFWFRTQHRRAEVGLRLAVGSTRKSIWAMLTNEGMLLLITAAIPALVICYNLGHSELVNKWQLEWGMIRFIVCIIATFLLMSIMIVAGIWYPARQAMKVQPAEALHDE